MMTTKDKIVQGVITFIKDQQNLEQITLSKIAKKVGIGKSTVYEHFSSKEDIIVETYKHLLKEYEGILTSPLESKTYKDQMMEQLAKILYVMKDARVIMEALLTQSQNAFSNIHDDIHVYAKDIQDKMNKRFQMIFSNAVLEGIISPNRQRKHENHVIQAIISGLLYQYVNQDFKIEEDELFELIYDNIIVVLNA